MKSLRADLAAATQDERAGRTKTDAPSPGDDARTQSREQLHRAEALVGEFRARVRGDLRTHIARGGSLGSTVIDDLESALDSASRSITRALHG